MLLLSAVMYVLFAKGLYSLGAKHQYAVVHKTKDVGQFPEGYFTMLAVQLIPLLITGLLLHDAYIIGTRSVTLFMVILVYGMVTSADGTFDSPRYNWWMGFWAGVPIIGAMIWLANPSFQKFVYDYEALIAWSSVIIMVVFVAKGQLAVMKALFKHFLLGNYTLKRFRLQVIRYFGFELQALHYWCVPSSAKQVLGFDPIYLQGTLGALGVFVIIVGAVAGFVRGTVARREHKRADREALNQQLGSAIATA